MKGIKFILLISLLLASYALAEEEVEENLLSICNNLGCSRKNSKHPEVPIPWFTEMTIERKCTNDKCRSRTDGFELEYKGEGRYDLDFYSLHTYGYVSASMKMTYNPGKSDQTTKDIQFIGKNFLLTQSINRYLIIDGKCTHYHELIGIPGDPLKTILDKFNHTEGNNKSLTYYKYQEHKKNGDIHTTTVTMDISSDFKTIKKIETHVESNNSSAVLTVNYKKGKSRSTFSDTPRDADRLFNRHEKFNCKKVNTFKAPEVCIEGILALEYC